MEKDDCVDELSVEVTIRVRHFKKYGRDICSRECPFIDWKPMSSSCRLFGSLRKEYMGDDVRSSNCKSNEMTEEM